MGPFVAQVINKIYNNKLKLSIYNNKEVISLGTSNFIQESIPSVNKEFGHYLAGYIEGDGWLITPLTLKNKSGTNNVCSVQIIFHICDLEFVKLLQNRIGHGRIYYSKKTRTVRLMIQNLEGVLLIIKLINGKMRTPKITNLYNMIDWLNEYKLENKIVKLPLDNSSIDSNSWLSGFIDTDGSFSIKGFTNNIKTYPGFQFYICQKEKNYKGESYKNIMENISKYLRVSLKWRNINNYPQFTVTTSNYDSNKYLINYLDKYPLFTSKYLNYMDWLNGFNIFNNKSKNHPIILKEIRLLKSKMNKNREIFTWNHLKDFY